jgi:hypothetical protein
VKASVSVVAGRSHHERAEVCRPRDGAGFGAVGEGRERLDHRGERDANGVVRGPVSVRIDGALEAGDEKVATAEDSLTRFRVLPAEDPERQDLSARSDAESDSGHSGSMRLEARGLVRAALRGGISVPGDEVVPVPDMATKSRVHAIDACVEERDRDAAAVEAG